MPYQKRINDVIKYTPGWKKEFPKFEIDLELYNTLEDSLPSDLMFTFTRSKLEINKDLWSKTTRQNSTHMPKWNIDENGLNNFNYNGIIKTLRNTSDYGLPDREDIIKDFSNNYRRTKIDSILK